MNKLQPVRGTKDLLPENFKIHQYIINVAQMIGELYGYSAMSTPIIEYAQVFDRTLGQTSDVISKEMYSFLDKSNETIALRPEFTAGIMRSIIHGSLLHNLPVKFFSYGPLFRYDRPQAGRQRQFHQVNFEYIGASGAYSDAETIKLAFDLLVALEISDQVTLEINSLGCHESRLMYEKKLFEYFNDHKNQLSADSVVRLGKNPMRILDSKDENDRLIINNAPVIAEYYTDFSKQYFSEVLAYLNLLKVSYRINNRLVRGLDYYSHTAFEYTTTALGAQSTVLAGGRYDGLAKLMQGPDIPAIGFAAGIERIALIKNYMIPAIRPVFILPISENNINISMILADKLRQNDVNIMLDAQGKINKRIQRAVSRNARYVIFIGDEEQERSIYKLKDLDTTQESILQFEQLMAILKYN
ncbi:Histidine--tRNA ligase [Candidatus Trichorickettsia mobilis]|uniref:Histidine--tRNA ligase n=2 Tax=Candidatus Trichorickettsia mobilis TaxID=1346319 RepID=A0ABZ0UWP6_9RICK|nr:Histidine--tRNA ligase [Candidatus Trichorickettsia mobilis]